MLQKIKRCREKTPEVQVSNFTSWIVFSEFKSFRSVWMPPRNTEDASLWCTPTKRQNSPLSTDVNQNNSSGFSCWIEVASDASSYLWAGEGQGATSLSLFNSLFLTSVQACEETIVETWVRPWLLNKDLTVWNFTYSTVTLRYVLSTFAGTSDEFYGSTLQPGLLKNTTCELVPTKFWLVL